MTEDTVSRPEPMPVGAILASALMAANIPCDSGEDVDRLIAEMWTRGLRVTPAPITEGDTVSTEVNLPFPTTDAHQWAAEFVRLHGGDEGLMLAWFANAIEHGRGPDETPVVAPHDPE